MSKEPQQCLRDATIQPTNDMICECLGSTGVVYKKFIEELKEYEISLMDWRFYNDGKAWLSKGEYKWSTKRGTEKVKPLFWISIWNCFFKISFNFSEKNKDQILSLPISEHTKDVIHTIQPNGNTMKFIPIIFDVENEGQFEDIFLLAQFRKTNI